MRATVTQMRAAAVLLLCLCGLAAGATAQEHARPDVILITIDTLRADHLGCYGYKNINTRAIDEVARRGIRFANAFTASPITNSSHASILTGLYPGTHGVSDFGVPLDAKHVTIAEALKQRGYTTAAFIGAVVLDSNQLAPGFNRGFDKYDNFYPKSGGSRFGRLERRAMDVVQHAETWMSAHPSGARLVWLHLYDPHDPYEPPPPYSQRYKNRPYDGEIAYADHAVGAFVAYLRSQRRYENSLVVIVGDHGEGLGQHGEDTHGIFLYDSTMHVPLIVKLPGSMHAGKVVSSQVRTVDIVPTILDYADPAAAGKVSELKLEGASLRNYLESGTGPDRPAIGETEYPLRFGWAPLRSLRADGFKFIEAPRPELYDLHHDPRESQNNYEPWSEQVQRSRQILSGLKKPAQPPNLANVPQGTVDELKALGYLGPEGATNVPEPSLLPDPKDKIAVQNQLHIAMMAGEEGRQEEARQALSKAVELDPKSGIALAQLGKLELKRGQYLSAKQHLLNARELRPEDGEVALNLGVAMAKGGDLSSAKDMLQQAIKLSPGQSDARELLAEVLMKSQQPKAAIEQYEAAVFVSPEKASTRIAFARVLIADGEFERAVAQAKQAIRIAPHNRDAYLVMQQAYEKSGQPALARRAGKQAAAIRTPNP